MDINLTDLKDISAIAKPFIEPLVSTLITPHLKKIEKYLRERGDNKKVLDAVYQNKFENYISRSYEKYTTMNVLVFPNQQINIKDIYYPLSIVSSNSPEEYEIDSFDIGILKKYQKILISDSAGMGKSTLLKWVGLTLIEQGDSIPILIELKRLTRDNKLIDEIIKLINPLDESFDKDLIYKFLEFGQFTILLDGFDEIQYEQRESVINDIKAFINKTNKNGFIMTSRREDSLSSFGEFKLFSIKPLKINESYSLLRKYDSIGKFNVGEKLINDIADKLKQVQEFLVNPFLVSLLYKTYTYNKNIPSKKSTFYDEVYGALYKQHDLSKDHFEREKKSDLDIYDFRIVLRQLAFDTAKVIKVEYSNQEILEYIKNAKETCALNFKEADFLLDLETNVPLFIRDGNLIKWAHKSLQDYFAAEWISYSPQREELLKKIYESKKSSYLNIIDFLYELEPKAFRKIIVLEIMNQFINNCSEALKNNKNVSESLMTKRQGLIFANAFIFDPKMSGNPSEEWEKLTERNNQLVPGFKLRSITFGSYSSTNHQECHSTSFNYEISRNTRFKR